MEIEIERKFLLKNDNWKLDEQGSEIIGTAFRQGYLKTEDITVRVRLEGNRSKLTIKGKTEGMSRLEYAYVLPLV